MYGPSKCDPGLVAESSTQNNASTTNQNLSTFVEAQRSHPRLDEEDFAFPRQPLGYPTRELQVFRSSIRGGGKTLSEGIPEEVFYDSNESSEEGFPALRETPENIMTRSHNGAYAEEKAEVELLYTKVTQQNSVTKTLRGLQGRLEGGGNTVKESLGPVHNNTRANQTVMDNAERIITHVDKILEPGQDKRVEEQIIRAGPENVGLVDFMASLKRVDKALIKLTSSNMRANQQLIGDYNELLNEGSVELQSMFHNLLAPDAHPVEPLHYITKQLPFPTISRDKTADLAAMGRFIDTAGGQDSVDRREAPSVRIYSDVRGPYLVSCLHSLSLASISTSKRKNSEEPYRQGTSAIGTYASSIEGLFRAEFQNISAIFPQQEWGLVYEATCRKALAEFAKVLRELNVHIKSNLTTDCFLAYEIIEIVSNVSHRLNQETSDLKFPFADAMKPIRESAKASITELLEDNRRRINALPTLPPDGAVIPYTTEIMRRLQTMTAYRQSLSSILASIGDGNWTSSLPSMYSNTATTLPTLKSLDVGADGALLLTHYITDTLDTHLSSLEARGRALHKSKAVAGVFMCNSTALVDRMIRSSDLASLLASSQTAQSKIDAYRKKGTKTYLDSWHEPCVALLDVQHTNRPGQNRPASGSNVPSADIIKSLSSKDKDAIKEKFKNFNSSFENCVRVHREMLGGMEREVRSGLSREVGNVVEPLYARFHDRYEALDRGRGKYVKFDKGALAGVLAGLG